MKKEEQASLVHELGLGKRRRHAHQTSQTLPQGVMSPLDVGGLSGFFLAPLYAAHVGSPPCKPPKSL